MDVIGVEVWRGDVPPWECDVMGHLNVRFHISRSAEGLIGLAAELGMPDAFREDAGATLLVREQHVRFLREAHAGASLFMTAGVVEMGECDATLLLMLRHEDGRLSSTFLTTVSHVTARAGRPFPWPGRVRAAAEALRIEVPAEAAPRGLSAEPATVTASLTRANELGLARTATSAIRTGECDPFGRLRLEQFMARLSSAGKATRRLQGDVDEIGKIGAAAMEYRLVYADWPRVGDRLELRSGQSGGDARFRRLTHWLLDPNTGRPWASAQALIAPMDLERRKLAPLSDEALARADALVIPGLTF
ncbi:thioesterase family protein [Phenylobacterium sp.]|uniref:thioesterase family protein n=1 Tax=Phenylobacterium sp. TaxID=1871053 RepID=UPI0037848FC4